MTKKPFGQLPSGQQAHLYTIRCGALEAAVTDFGATLVSLWVPDKAGNLADVVLGFDDPNDYIKSGYFLGATVGRNANRVAGASFHLNGTEYALEKNNNENNLHSGSDSYAFRLWNVFEHTESSISLTLESPNGDQGFPGNAKIMVTYALEYPGKLHITYDAVCDEDTVFNMTNHSYFNLAGHENGHRAMEQILSVPGRSYVPVDAEGIPTGKLAEVEGTPMDFRTPKPIGRDIDVDFTDLHMTDGYDHCYEVFCSPCAILSDPISGRTMSVITDTPGVQLYTANDLQEVGKGGAVYGNRSAVCLETEYYPDAVNHPQWQQPIFRAGERYHSETKYIFA